MIEIRNLVKRFGNLAALNDLSFDIVDGETFALLGPNGSGKTTLLKCMVGLTLPTSGSIRIDGLDLQLHGREARRRMSYLPQRVSFDDSLTAKEVMRFYCRLRKIDPSRIEALPAGSLFLANGAMDKPVGQFSGGMVQRLGIAVACLPDAPVLLLDEPTLSLDPEGAKDFRCFLASLKNKGRTIVLSSHTLTDVEHLADRVAILVGGKLAAVESIDALREDLQRRSMMRVTLRAPNPRGAEAARQAGAEEVVLADGALLITSLPEYRYTILRAIEAAGGEIDRITTHEPALEDTYLRYIGVEAKSHA